MAKTKKIRKLIKAANMEKPHAMYELGLRYELGRGVRCDMAEAVYWIDEAARVGYAPAIEWMQDYRFDDDAQTQAYS